MKPRYPTAAPRRREGQGFPWRWLVLVLGIGLLAGAGWWWQQKPQPSAAREEVVDPMSALIQDLPVAEPVAATPPPPATVPLPAEEVALTFFEKLKDKKVVVPEEMPPAPAREKPPEAPALTPPAGTVVTPPAGTVVVPPSGTVNDEAGPFVVQVASFPSFPGAAKLADRLSRKGTPAHVQQAAVDGHAVFRVRLGPFAGRNEALRMAEQWRKSGGTALVTKAD